MINGINNKPAVIVIPEFGVLSLPDKKRGYL